jgi:hypothetical protein
MFYRTRPFETLGIVLGLTSLLVIYSGLRLKQMGHWLPSLPDDVHGIWTSAEAPLPRAALVQLGSPASDGRQFLNPFRERVEAHIIATQSFDAYQESGVLLTRYGYSQTAEKIIPLFGKDRPIRALILRNLSTGQRVLMYYWVQYRDGSTATRRTPRSGRDIAPRLRIGLEAVLKGEPNCIVRVYTQIHPADVKGNQARRNLNEISKALYETMTGKKLAPPPASTPQKTASGTSQGAS